MKRFLKEHSLGLTFVALTLICLVVYWFVQYPDWAADQKALGEAAPIYPDYWTFYWAKLFEGWQAEFLQSMTLIFLTKWLVEKKSAESNDQNQ